MKYFRIITARINPAKHVFAVLGVIEMCCGASLGEIAVQRWIKPFDYQQKEWMGVGKLRTLSQRACLLEEVFCSRCLEREK